jgi:hypothetical protein
MPIRALITLVALGGLGFQGAYAASPTAGGARDRAQFARLLKPAAATRSAARPTASAVRVRDASQLPPGQVARFDSRLSRYLNRFGTVPPPATDRLPANVTQFRQQFIATRFTPGASVGGVFFTTAATPTVPSGVNVFTFFPVYRTTGVF